MSETQRETVYSDKTALQSLCEWLKANADLADGALERASRAAEASGERIDVVLTKLGLVGEDVMMRAYADVFDLEILKAEQCPAEPILADVLQPVFLKNARLLPLKADEAELVVALVDPLDHFSVASIEMKTGLTVQTALIAQSEFAKVFELLYGSARDSNQSGAEQREFADELTTSDIARLRDQASDAPVIRIVDRMIREAVETNASDIHISASRTGLRVRHRVDGVLRDIQPPSADLRAAIISRLKIMANLDIAEQRLPQDGRIRAVIKGHEIDLRLATMPHLYGEGAVLRVLDRSQLDLDFEALGFDAHQIENLDEVLGYTSGVFLVTGPTGSGKTTTLYAALNKLAAPERNIVTIEDPIEYQVGGVNQVQVQPKIGLDFARALRAILRQDPDIVMIGEIRDAETASIANQAALTGHLVLATLHTNTAASAITRLVDMGLEDYLLASTIRGVLSQRLVRRLCDNCKRTQPLSKSVRERISVWLKVPQEEIPQETAKAVGCSTCHGTGYSGRTVVGEILTTTDAIRTQLLHSPDANKIQQVAEADGMVTMRRDGWSKVLAGVTSFDEVVSVTQVH